MAYLTNLLYYTNNDPTDPSVNWGSYQYLSLNDIVLNFEQFYTGDDKVLDHVKRTDIIFHAKKVVRELNYDAFKEIKVLEVEVDSTGRVILPHNYVDYIRISYEKNGILYPMLENRVSTTAAGYLRDVSGDLVFEEDGSVTYDTSILESVRLTTSTSSTVYLNDCEYHYRTIMYGQDTSKMNVNPKFNINRDLGTIEFNSTMVGELIVIEYIHDGMEGGNNDAIVVHKFFEEYVYNEIEYNILRLRPSTPMSHVLEAKKKRRSALTNAKIRIMGLRPNQLLMSLRGQENWIK